MPTVSNPPALALSGRIPELDGIRGIAIAMVLLFHYFFQPIDAPAGSFLSSLQGATRLSWSGVDLFFVLSGFLIGGILLDARDSSNYFRVFYVRRFFRIVPIYFVFLFLALGLCALGNFGITSDFLRIFRHRLPWLPHFLFLQNFWMALTSSFGASGLTVTWSLAVEEQFYLSLPALIRFLTLRALSIALAAGIVLAPLSRILLHAFAPSHNLSWYTLMPCRADALLLGVFGAILLRNAAWNQRLRQNRRIFLFLLFPLALGLVAMTPYAPDPYGFAMLSFGYSWLALFYLCLILSALLYRESWFASFLRWSWLTWLGSIAYGVYLFHELFRYALHGLFYSGAPPSWSPRDFLISLFSLVLLLFFCRLSWLYFEKPLVKLGHRFSYQFRETVPPASHSGVSQP